MLFFVKESGGMMMYLFLVAAFFSGLYLLLIQDDPDAPFAYDRFMQVSVIFMVSLLGFVVVMAWRWIG